MGAAILITLGVLFLMENYGVVPFDRSFPVLLLVIGCMLLISRTGSTEGHIERGWSQGPAAPQPPQPWTTTGVVPPPPTQQWTPGAGSTAPSGENDSQVKP
ncbi:MAG TPA: DUF5668 domain-containing protein [Candidatus Angelobacter sp.]|nr:DUF5668 domain-containing protein [Candidatus Angelobacter sp.]